MFLPRQYLTCRIEIQVMQCGDSVVRRIHQLQIDHADCYTITIQANYVILAQRLCLVLIDISFLKLLH